MLMYIKSFISFVLIFFLSSCAEKNNTDSSDNAVNSFAKIDKKNESLFTKEDRKKSYIDAISEADKNRNSLKNNVAYNGYGAAAANSKKSSSKSKNKETSKASIKKKTNYSYIKSSAPQTYSAYSTN